MQFRNMLFIHYKAEFPIVAQLIDESIDVRIDIKVDSRRVIYENGSLKAPIPGGPCI